MCIRGDLLRWIARSGAIPRPNSPGWLAECPATRSQDLAVTGWWYHTFRQYSRLPSRCSMKTQRVRPWISALAALVLLASTAMPALGRMTCASSGHTVLSIGQAKDCCPGEDRQEGSTIRAICCEFQQAAPQRAEFNAEHPIFLPLPVFPFHPVRAAIACDARVLVSSQLGSRRPPPLVVLERLSQLSSFRI